MASQLQGLMKEAAYYSTSSLVGRLFNVLLVPLYTSVMPPNEGEYGMMTSLYGWGSLITVILSMGLETTFMRIANKNEDEVNPAHVYSTAFITILALVAVFGLSVLLLSPWAAYALGYPTHISEVQLMGLVICGDVLLVLPFCYLRYRHKVAKYAICKALYAFINALLSFVVLFLCPILQQHWPEGILWEFYLPHNSLNYVIGCNLITCFIMLYIMIEEWKPFGHFYSAWNRRYSFHYIFDRNIFRQMMIYALPILGASLIDIGIQTIDRLIYLWLIPGAEGMRQLGIYGACFRIAMIMALATQVLRDVSEPTLFRLQRSHRTTERTGALIIKCFLIFSIGLFLAIETSMSYIERYLLLDRQYWEGTKIIPILMASEIMVGMQFYMSFWYKLSDQPKYGTWFAALTLVVIVSVIVIFVPFYGYIACAWAIFAGCLVRLLATTIVSRFKSPYHFKYSGYRYIVLGSLLYFSMCICPDLGENWTFTFKFACFVIYVEMVIFLEHRQINNALSRIKQRGKKELVQLKNKHYEHKAHR